MVLVCKSLNMEMNQVKISVVVAGTIIVNCAKECNAEDLCLILCKKFNIPPLSRILFALRIKDTDLFLKDNSKVFSEENYEYEFRIRYKVPRLGQLITSDETTFDYYFKQARSDVYHNKIPEIKYPDHKKELLGLGIADMTRAVSEENLVDKYVINKYKKYIPKVIINKHGSYCKKYARDYLPNLCKYRHNANYLKNIYLQQLYDLAPNYLAEEFENVYWQSGEKSVPVKVVVAPFHVQYPGIRFYDILKRDCVHVCTIEDLIYLRRKENNSLEISRKGTPLSFKFDTEQQLSSFISLCDGYYRLMVKWTFNLSKDDETPSLLTLKRLKCHGPVGGAFSIRKLEEKRAKKHGCYILRQCQYEYNVYYLDVCMKDRTIQPYKIEFRGKGWLFNKEEYQTIDDFVKAHQNSEEKIFLNECIPPSEYDKSQLLLCAEPLKTGVRIDQADLQEVLKDNKCPRCLPSKDILLYTGSEKYGSSNITTTYKALWKLDETKKLLVAFKTLQKEKTNDYLKDYIELASVWACIQSSSIVRLYGVTLSSPTALVLEYLPYGPFDVYLRDHREKIKPIHLKKVAAGLARALWDLSEAGVVHGHIRCRKLLLAAHDGERIIVKLSGPTVQQYKPQDVHWLPVELYSDMNLAKRSVLGDIWAFATTLWEVFSYGLSPTETNPVLTAKSYESGNRLQQPSQCPNDVWHLMKSCWQRDPSRPQIILRDMNYMLYNDYYPVDGYETVDPPQFPFDRVTYTGTNEGTICIFGTPSETDSTKTIISDGSSVSMTSFNGTDPGFYNPPDWSVISLDNSDILTQAPRTERSSRRTSAASSGAGVLYSDSCPAPRLMQSIVSQGKTYLVTLNKKIGSGNYGHVYKGLMERDTDNQESGKKEVAVKKLTRQPTEPNGNLYKEFKNELDIMKSLQHYNIVEILGYSWDHGSEVLIVMEYLEEGSLNYYLKSHGDQLRIPHLLQYALDIASGMDYISAKKMVHRDLATRNILVVNKHRVKISDFGLARIIPNEENEYKIKTDRELPLKWYAPESAVKPWRFSTKSDVWSYGVTAWEIFTRAEVEVPEFDRDRATERAACFQIPEDCPSEIYRDLLVACWELEPMRRPNFITLGQICKRFMEDYK